MTASAWVSVVAALLAVILMVGLTLTDAKPKRKPVDQQEGTSIERIYAAKADLRQGMVDQETATMQWDEVRVSNPAGPGFHEFGVLGSFSGSPAPLNFTFAPQGRAYRAVLERAVAQGPNFAGYYTVATWSCGDECHRLAVIDLRSGEVFLPQLRPQLGVSFRLNSRLLIETPPEAVQAAWRDGKAPERYRTRYYLWQANGFELIDFAEYQTYQMH